MNVDKIDISDNTVSLLSMAPADMNLDQILSVQLIAINLFKENSRLRGLLEQAQKTVLSIGLNDEIEKALEEIK